MPITPRRFCHLSLIALAAAFATLQPGFAQEYLLPAPTPPTASCNAIVSHGSDQPETHTIDVSGTTGTVEFQYNTYGIEDRMTVAIDGNPVFDSGCVGTGGTLQRRISLRPGAMKVQVRIDPNCTGGTGTSRNFKLLCPEP